MPPKRHKKGFKKMGKPKDEPAIYQFPPLHTFGFSGIKGKLGQIACVDSQSVLFAIGCGLYRYSNFCSVQVVPTEASLEKINALVATETGRHVAVCEKHIGAPSLVSVYEMKGPRLVRKFITNHIAEIDICGFSKDEKQIVASCSSTDGCVIYCWDVELPRERFIYKYPHAVTRLSVSRDDNDVFAFSGPTHFKLWNIKEQDHPHDAIEGMAAPEGTKWTFTDHVWLFDNSVAVATANDIIFIVREGIVKHKLDETGHTICLAATPVGFYVVKKDGAIILHYGWDTVIANFEVRSRTPYADVRCKTVASELSQITTLVVAPTAENVVYIVEVNTEALSSDCPGEKSSREASIEGGMELGESVGRLEFTSEEDPLVGAITSDPGMPVFTVGPITDMDVCLHRMLIVTCGKDKVVRIWSYARLNCEISCPFEEEAFAVAISTYQILVAFATTIKIYRLMAEKVEQIHEIIMKGVRQLRFSPSGHLVAVAAGRDVILLSTSSWKLLTMLKGHMGAVSSVTWSPDSIYLSSAGTDGAVYSWFMDGFLRYAECVTKGSSYSSILYDRNRKYIYACGPHIPLRAVETDKKVAIKQSLPEKASDDGSAEADTEDDESSGSRWEHHIFRAYLACEMKPKGVTRIAGMFGRRLLIATTETGELLLYTLPLPKDSKAPVWEEHINAGKITSLYVDEKRSLIFMGSTQGSLIMLSVRKLPFTKDIPDPPSPRGFLPVGEDELVNIVPVYWTELEEAKGAALAFSRKMKEEYAEMLYKDHIKEQDWAIVVKEKNELHAKIESEFALKLRLMEQRILMAESEKETSIQSLLDSQELNLKEMNEYYEQKIIEEAKKAHSMRLAEQKEGDRILGIMKDMQRAYQEKLEKLQWQLEGAQTQADMKVHEVEKVCDIEVKKCKQSFDMELMVNDEELETTMKRLTEKLLVEHRKAEWAYGQMSYEKNLSVQYQAQLIQIAELEKEYDVNLQEFLQENLRLKKLMVEVDTEHRRTKQLLLQTDERSEKLLQHNKDEETMHMVHDFKIQQLLRRKDPTEAEMRRLRKYLQQMEGEQAGALLDLRQHDNKIRDLRDKIGVYDIQLKQLHDKLLERETYINVFTMKLSRIVDENEDTEWSSLAKELYDTFVKDVHRAMNNEGVDAKEQILHQRQVLQKFVKVLEEAIIRIDGEHVRESQWLVKENLRLLHQFSDSNRNARRLALIVKELQGEEAYFKAVAAKHRYVTVSVLHRMSQTRESKLKVSNDHMRSKSALANRLRPPSLSPEAKFHAQLREKTKSTEPIARIIDPAIDTRKRSLPLRNLQELPQPGLERNPSSPDISLALTEVKFELKKKDKQIEHLQKNLHRLSLKSGASPEPGAAHHAGPPNTHGQR